MKKESMHSFLDIHPSQKDGQSKIDFAQHMNGVFIMIKCLACHTDEMQQICDMLNSMATPHPIDSHSAPIKWVCRMQGHQKRITGKQQHVKAPEAPTLFNGMPIPTNSDFNARQQRSIKEAGVPAFTTANQIQQIRLS